MKTCLALLLLFATSAYGATYHVRVTGSDSDGVGTESKPWRTIQKGLSRVQAGDTLRIGPGEFPEYVQSFTAGTSDKRITVMADTITPGGPPVVLRALRLNHPNYTVQGLTFRGASDSHRPGSSAWSASIRIESLAHNAIIRSNVIRDTPSVISDDFRFGSISNTIHTDSGDFVAAGFVPQAHVFLGACSLIPFTNHNTAWLVAKMTKNTLWVTNSEKARFRDDPGSNYWAAVHAGDTAAGMTAISLIPRNSLGATNCHIVGNSVSNNFGSALDIFGERHLIEGNRFTMLNSFYGARLHANNTIIRSNSWINLPNILWYSPWELGEIPHPPGSGWFDYQVGTFHSAPLGRPVTNVVFEYNWVQNSENQLGTCGFAPESHTAIYRNNVFVGIGAHHNNGRHNMQWVNNTFYKSSYDATRTMVLATGGSSLSTVMNGINISSNLFIACGDHSQLDSEGFYAITKYVTNLVTDANFVAGPEVTGWLRKRAFVEANGVNGGDPLFRDEFDPLGPDGLPFTADDGLRPLPNSIAAQRRLGALTPWSPPAGIPAAHFSLVSPAGWHEPTRGNYDLEWLTKTPWERKGPQRPFGTVDSLPAAPCTVTFSAADSYTSPENRIVSYSWDFGDGNKAETTSPSISHTFTTSSGDRWVQLTVKTASGTSDVTRRRYRLPGSEPPAAPQPPVGLRIEPD